MPGGETILIPESLESGNRARFFFDYAPPSGTDTIRVFASVDPETTRTIRDYVSQLSGEVTARSLGSAKTFRSMRYRLLPRRGIIVVSDRPEEVEVSAGGDALDEGEHLGEDALPEEGVPPAEEEFVDEGGFADEGDFTTDDDQSGGLEGDWTAASITIVVEE